MSDTTPMYRQAAIRVTAWLRVRHIVLRWILVIDVCLALVFYGSSKEPAFLIIAILTHALAIATVWITPMPSSSRRMISASASLIFLILAWTSFQAFGDLGTLVQAFSQSAKAAFPPGSISLAPSDTLDAILRATTPLVAFMTTLYLVPSDNDAEWLIRCLRNVGAATSIFSIIQFIVSPESILFEKKLYYISSLTGLFVNHNTAATFFGVVLLLSITCARAELERRQRKTGLWIDFKTGFSIVAALLALCALVLTRSRGGLVCTSVGLLILFAIPYRQTDRETDSFKPFGWAAGKQILLGMAGLIILVALSGRTLLAVTTKGLDDPRFCVLPSLLQIFRDHLSVGTGFGTFQIVFPAYRDPACGIIGVWDKAHNFYLEGAITLGIPFFALLIATVALLVWAFRTGLSQRSRSRKYVILGISAASLVALHAAVDFALQIPGFNVFFAVMIGACVAISCGRRKRPKPLASA